MVRLVVDDNSSTQRDALDVTVCVTTYNRWTSCLSTLESILSQVNLKHEVILVDDCSSGSPPDEIERMIENDRVRFFRQAKNWGLAAARNTGISNARGRYFSFCDDDDAWPESLGHSLLSAIQRGPAGCRMALAFHPRYQRASDDWIGRYARLKELMRKGVTPPVSSQMYETDMLRAIGGYNEAIRSGVDHDLWVTLAKIDPVVAVCWVPPAVPGRDPRVDRMTTREAHRRENIERSLLIWRSAIVADFGDEFYNHFRDAYRQHIEFGFIVNHVRQKNYLGALSRGMSWKVAEKLMSQTLRHATGTRTCAAFPEFRPRSRGGDGTKC